ncbi:BMP family ABC transporter substrate-binding protein [Streptosporangium sp. NBC_01755]|uniref:BMP family lipoprotein n=1 Tax=unclassified Streptosporangium TaxID=2632669 RepID=UPI002DDAD397|nr:MULTISPECIES: BMP family ABC transporter substrate-binding protein [unclassified Streptosporangium]WSA24287.1 BMP family ABC transporter substrate-binding protein [Streptosporangium sp. NBC_01810]WSC97639.1 BMP family ABC transporter substrate-binding protein [Streptosporangium sp. NBC_01755]
MLRSQFGKMTMATAAGAMLMAAAACGGGTDTAASPAASAGASSEAPQASGLKVGLAYDVGGRGDKSFNDSAYAGLERAQKELGAEIKDLSPAADGSNRGELLRQLAEAGYNPIVGVGFAYGEDIQKAAAEFPDIQFAVVDSASNGPNVTGLLFAEEQGSYLAGVAAAEKSKAKHLGFVGGVENDLIKKFQAGFEAGAKSIKSDIKVDIKYLTPDGDFSGFKAPDKGKIAAEKMYQDGADIVYHASGDSGLGVFQAAAAAGKQAIGVDSDQYETVKEADLKKVIMTSMLKRVDVGVFEFIKAFQGGAKGGTNSIYDLKVDGVGLSTSGGFIDDVTAKVDEAKKKIVDGSITVPSKP